MITRAFAEGGGTSNLITKLEGIFLSLGSSLMRYQLSLAGNPVCLRKHFTDADEDERQMSSFTSSFRISCEVGGLDANVPAGLSKRKWRVFMMDSHNRRQCKSSVYDKLRTFFQHSGILHLILITGNLIYIKYMSSVSRV
ncbi:hypothetical protein CEXT_80341 [Caerostris extrusa]|uniref:Uncharacterized protein n=1 Tax=Caerostris extrusa TaxID=172846 RepID=A0AAV4W5Z5_CAEEX|nr:hypothetical protein CEXT_80341 [Caerostris extrusa]